MENITPKQKTKINKVLVGVSFLDAQKILEQIGMNKELIVDILKQTKYHKKPISELIDLYFKNKKIDILMAIISHPDIDLNLLKIVNKKITDYGSQEKQVIIEAIINHPEVSYEDLGSIYETLDTLSTKIILIEAMVRNPEVKYEDLWNIYEEINNFSVREVVIGAILKNQDINLNRLWKIYTDLSQNYQTKLKRTLEEKIDKKIKETISKGDLELDNLLDLREKCPNGTETINLVEYFINKKLRELLDFENISLDNLWELEEKIPNGTQAEKILMEAILSHTETDFDKLPSRIKRGFLSEIVTEKIKRIL